MKTYTDFEQIDRDLQILKLEQKIDFEKMKMNVQDVKESFSPINVVSGIFGNIIKKALILKTVNKLIGK
ncbi:hypothetical protein EJ995_02435 [Nonlabens ponticola]|uniref:Glutaminyl-tRNA synthetase n=1 Tax=Nonlabens ponticola TaxID=2496866 RepID=A0A3S9N0T9_9FLAO|nr:hypothetical protein EJ995_02435 [Nonlabens ponticola]